ncbi:sodium channel protein para-like isoform X2 [Centruroides vittatus]|uniref:sodium channel protein para-like isoform X2 n=1 Tax=Centruroides vittatus TaxID=120091 RepID=UPI00350EFBF3
MSSDEQSEDEAIPTFRPFTRESLAAIEARIAEAEARKKEQAQKKEEGGSVDDEHYGTYQPETTEPNPVLEAGLPLPKQYEREFPPELLAVPIEDLDKFYENQRTFVVISKGKDIFRFSATKAMWILGPFNPIRRAAIGVLVHPAFSFLVIVTILVNCVLMTQTDVAYEKELEKAFTAIYTIESCIKATARGFILEQFTYLRDPWNWLDFIVISLAYITMGVELGNLSALRTFRVLRALKTVAVIPGLKTIVGAVIESVKNLKDVIILTVFSLSLFALLGLQLYMGVLMQKCIKIAPENTTYEEKHIFYGNKTNWLEDPKGGYLICGNSSGARQCPNGSICLPNYGPNPDNNFTNFDTFYWAFLASFRLMTQDFWEGLYQMVLRTAGPWHICFFIIIIFLGSFYLLNLILAIVAMSYDELQKRAEKEEEDALLEEEKYNAAVERRRLLEEEKAGVGVVKSSSASSCGSYDSFVGQDKGAEDKDASVKSVDGDSIGEPKSQINGKVRKASLSLPGSPFNPRRGSRGSQFSVSWRNGRRYGDRKPLVLQTYMDAQEHLPYADDSKAVTPMSEDGGIVIPVYTNLNSRHSSYTSHLSRISYTSHCDMYNRGLTKEGQLISRSRKLRGHYSQDSLDDVEYGSKQKPYDSPFMDPQRQTELDMKDVMVLNEIIDQAAGRQSRESGRVSIYYFPAEREPEEKQKFKEKCIKHCLRFIDIFCVWDCCNCWLFIQKIVKIIVFDPFMELFITLAIIVNTLFMSIEHADMDKNFLEFLKNGNYFFTATFAIEASFKLIALSPKYYFKEGWNIFDFLIVVLSLVELFGENVALPGLSVLRSFRLLRVFKLAKSWPTLNLLISIMGKTVGALGNLTFVLGIIIFIFAVMGMQLFGENYEKNKDRFPNKTIPRWHFGDFLHSFMIVFRVLCGEWIESMWGCMLVADWPCVPFFLSTVIIGNLVVLNLFLALLLSSFGASNLSQASPESADTKKLQEAFERIGRAVNWVKACFLQILKSLRPKARNQIADQTTEIREDLEDVAIGREILVDGQVIMKEKKSPKEITDLELVVGDGLEIAIQGNGQAIPIKMANNTKTLINSAHVATKVELKEKEKEKLKEKDNKEKDEVYGKKTHVGKDEDEAGYESTDNVKELKANDEKEISFNKPSKEESRISLPEASQEEKKDASKDDFQPGEVVGDLEVLNQEVEVDKTNVESEASEVIISEYPADCFPEKCYQRFPFCAGNEESKFWTRYATLRGKSYRLVENKYFESLIIFMILVSSLALALEDVNLKKRLWLAEILQYMDKIFTVLFFLEMLIKWLAFGFKKYFTNAWCWLDFVIVLVSMINLVATMVWGGNIPALKTMRTLRALRPLRALSRFQGMRVVVNALVQAIPAIFNVLLVCLIFWLIFSIMGVQLFAGKFRYCADRDGNPFNSSTVPNKNVCVSNNFTWANPKINFDNVLNAYLALFQVATFKGWIDIMNSAIDTRTNEGDQPEYEINRYMYLYFVLFIIIGSFFTLNLFIGVIIDNFNEQKKKIRGSLEMFMTEDQKKYYNAMKKMGSKKPAKAIPRPNYKLQSWIFDLVTNQKFDVAIMLFIGLNMLTMALDHHQPSATFQTVLERLNLFFIAIFTAECVLKMFALRWYFFKEPWNVFDFVIVILSVLSVAISDVISEILVSPTMLRVVRVVKIGRVLRLVKGARGIRTLLFALAMSLPALFNICLLLFLVMFIYAIFGMSFFMNVKHRDGVDENFNFETFGQSMIILFQMSTSAGWDSILAAIMDETDCTAETVKIPNCTSIYEPECEIEGDCGRKTIAVAYLVSYLIISFLIIINMYIAVILENYSQATEEVQEGLTDDDYDMYYDIWQKFDPEGTQFIKYEVLTDFIDSLEEPLQIPKPNKYKIISMDICICEGDLVFCVDILDALTKDFFCKKGISVDESEIAEVAPTKERGGLQPISSTLNRQREEYAARVIQQAWKQYRGRSSEEPRQRQQTAILVESDGHVTKNGHKVVIHSRSPSVTSRSTDV